MCNCIARLNIKDLSSYYTDTPKSYLIMINEVSIYTERTLIRKETKYCHPEILEIQTLHAFKLIERTIGKYNKNTYPA